MIYVFDTSPFATLFRHYYKSAFPSLWDKFDEIVDEERVLSTREVFREIEDRDDDLLTWAKDNQELFTVPTAAEAAFVGEIYKIKHFTANIDQKKILKGGKNADPFVIAKAHVIKGTVVTLEKFSPNSAKIPNICGHFKVPYMSFEDFMKAEGWKF
jgi:hypothetical protein